MSSNHQSSYLDSEFNIDLDDEENLDEIAPMTQDELIEHSNDENYKIISDMFNTMNDFINTKPYIFPIMQYLDRTNFDNWFSQFIIAQQPFSEVSNKRKK